MMEKYVLLMERRFDHQQVSRMYVKGPQPIPTFGPCFEALYIIMHDLQPV